MSVSVRVFFLEGDGFWRRVPFSRYERLSRREPTGAFAGCAGRKVKCAEAFVEVENRKPVGIRRINYCLLVFDADGYLDADCLKTEARLALGTLDLGALREDSRVVDGSSRFARKRLQGFAWKPDAALEAALVRAIMGGDSC